ncbi:DNA binding domain protein, excisionase family [Catenulispora acidiphila DSM 44928]|uniref:DNA binding domain protein, excisionase family n=1 Tax=Catenulispora acidiphila (strain DSM 44928 / JCM 14897 / NBRC 102108 / NRRL B-24433 / ID139908) TaxID=479433 RepID=C7Q3X6_CATAD|nr:helix-turn-helix domain-containing protein [Catenulispora acidiphila]ACU77734.1 DNA binding domain protein, excisionase family [Catenulispora acidiphila DSM 44928]
MIGPLYTVKETGLVLRTSRTTVYRLMKAGEIEGVRIKGSRRFTVRSVEQYVASQVTE